MRLLFTVLTVLLLAVALGWVLQQSPGEVVFTYRGWVIQTSLGGVLDHRYPTVLPGVCVVTGAGQGAANPVRYAPLVRT